MKLLHKLLPKILGKNLKSTPANIITDQMNERRPLPTGMTEFNEWCDRIVSGAMLNADLNSQKWTLAACLMQLGPQESHKEDAYFIHSLRKAAVNQVAHAVMQDLKAEQERKINEVNAKKEIKTDTKDNVVPMKKGTKNEVLADPKV